VTAPTISGKDVLYRLRELPGGEALLAVAAKRDDIELVGGAVRDLLLGHTPHELDVVVGEEGDSFARAAPLLAAELASQLNVLAGAEVTAVNEHERFITATVKWNSGQIDVATRRVEAYATPGALPEVGAGTREQDLQRRDFTVNAISVALGGSRRGRLYAAEHALEDLTARRLRVLHDQSFIDDPTRLLRLARYAARLDFEIEPQTFELARQAIADGALQTVSGARLGAELRLALHEAAPLDALAELQRLGVLSALHPRLRLEPLLLERALALLDRTDRPDLLILAGLALPLALRAGEDPRAEITALLDRLEFSAAERDRVAGAASAVPNLIEELPAAASVAPSRLREVAMVIVPEGIALAGAVSESAAQPARWWLSELRYVALRIDGRDLLHEGVPEGPEIGRLLDAVLRRRLDGELPDAREAQLRAALELR